MDMTRREPGTALAALHQQPRVQARAAPVRARERHALLQSRRPQGPGRQLGAVHQRRRALPAGDRQRRSPSSSRRSTSRRPSRGAIPGAFALADGVAALTPKGLDHVFFCNSGSEAVDTAMKVALAYHLARGEGQRNYFVSRERAYHGVNIGGTALSGMVQQPRSVRGADAGRAAPAAHAAAGESPDARHGRAAVPSWPRTCSAS